ncbi:hypothetical protein JCM19232_377 [Vibrio ishigakensis]|uniref:Uncharacterized protein n=1 Tax=Vibrio ishigakensis TaxID=1481914 RepID=A0A0B8PAU6_9VIBR|nr:hypothetical protein JCM19232_377 [Vibrio ishigakensis]
MPLILAARVTHWQGAALLMWMQSICFSSMRLMRAEAVRTK